MTYTIYLHNHIFVLMQMILFKVSLLPNIITAYNNNNQQFIVYNFMYIRKLDYKTS